ncbi:hypothetical protein QLX08_007393 [Tetragonisca angustula]|uniref:Chitin-binding type-2 domain-containing protein n=1 Tax=Tetragonisca angustula TaxID=166442 RepID=A0AAW0ZRL9_9HYME
MGLTEDPWNLSEFVDSSYTTDNIPDYQETATPYPLIEIAETMEHKYNLNADNASEINKENGYLQTQSDNKKYYSMLNQLIHHLLLYKKITIPLEFLASSSLSTSPGLVTNLPLANYLVQNYIQQNNNLQNTIITDVKLQNTSENNVKDDIIKPVSNENSKNSSVFDNMGDKNNIILITDHVGNRQYLTIERYKSMGYQLDSQYVQLIPCIKNTRMPNITDCTKYYICEPVIASVIEYSCPLFTAFNRFARTCDAESYNKCIENKNNANANSSGSIDNIFETNVSNKNICMEHGKTKDPTSESRYYICHSSPDNSQIKSIRMTCPNGLIFCQLKKVCTTKRLCKI